ncbi:hypothetical protein OC835_002724 [Tilletia horrida]|nr:hypothetical protein OC835_002724 [Tilletia horrida]
MAATAAGEAPAKRARKRSRGKHRSKKINGGGEDAHEQEQQQDGAGGDGDGDDDDDEAASVPPQASTSKTEAAPTKRKAALPPPPPPPRQEAGPKLSFYERVNPHKPSAKAIPSVQGARTYTISVALPGSIVLNAQTPELQARLAGQIARTCAIFNVDEIVVFDEGSGAAVETNNGGGGFGYRGHGKQREYADGGDGHAEGEEGGGGKGAGFDPNAFLARILQYLETPQYLRKPLFPMHRDLRLAGLLPPLDCPHHLRFQDRAPFREGVIVDGASHSEYPSANPYDASSSNASAKKRKRSHQNGGTVWVNVGLKGPIEVDVPPAAAAAGSSASSSPELGTRVTVRMPEDGFTRPSLCSPREPIESAGLYWGYTVRLAPSLGLALSDAPPGFGGGYDLIIGTSERGASLESLLADTEVGQGTDGQVSGSALHKPFRHAIIVLGGLSGLEDAVERDAGLQAGADEAHALFDVWVNLVEAQGSRTIRTEEAVMIALARLKGPLDRAGRAEMP